LIRREKVVYHNWLEMQVFAIDRQKEILRTAERARASARTGSRTESASVPEIRRPDPGAVTWPRAG
jgi:hypothetical protein